MPATVDLLPLPETLAPSDELSLAQAMREASERREAMYPIGGGTSLDYGLTAKQPGLGISLSNLNRVIDYPARDMTITVESGVTMAKLAETLATERQWLPIDAPLPESATIGGVVATAWSGPRRYGWGAIRDAVIGIGAVDGRGVAFHGGGRVVKNVAGYDFCKLLTGSCGTLGIITRITLKIKPIPHRSALVATPISDLASVERLLASLVSSRTTPSAIELAVGPDWKDAAALDGASPSDLGWLIVGLEGSESEVEWMIGELAGQWRALGVSRMATIVDDDARVLWNRMRDFPTGVESPLVVRASVRPSAVTSLVGLMRQIDPTASILAHAGNGVVLARFAKFEPGDISRALIGKLQPAAVAGEGHLVVLSSSGQGELTRQAVFGGVSPATGWMSKIKQALDPHNLLNPDRFGY